MAVKVERKVVCDFGEAHSGEIRHYRITVDGESTILDLCPNCAKPLTKLIGRSGRKVTSASSRGKVYSLEEIEARKQRNAPTR